MGKKKINNAEYRYLATYQVSMAARYLRMSPSTLTYWLKKNALLKPPETPRMQLSFVNLVEAHVLSALRHQGLTMQRIRSAIDELRNQSPEAGDHPLVTENFFTDGKYLMVEKVGKMINLNRGGQIEMRELIDVYLSRIDRDDMGPVRLHPFTVDPSHNRRRANMKPVIISPYVSFGRPAVSGIGVATEIVWGRFVSGDTQNELCDDYNLTPIELEEILRYESAINQAA